MWEKVSTKELIDETNKRGQIINEIMELHAPEKIFEDWPCEIYMMLEEHLLAPRKDKA